MPSPTRHARPRRAALSACLALLAALAPSAPAQTPKPSAEERMQGSLPIRLLAEAEDFTVEKPGWSVLPYRQNYFASTFAITFLSRMACLSAPEQLPAGHEALATQAVDLPRDGTFRVFVRYEQPLDYSAEFALEIEQEGAKVYSHQFGRLGDPRIWAFNLHKRVPMERYWWGGVDNIVWQFADSATLKKGKATIRLIAGPQMDGDKPRLNAARRNIDIVCLTDDDAGLEQQRKTRYLELDGWLTQHDDVFLRITNPAENNSPCAPRIGPCEQHSPHEVHVRDWPGTSVYRQGIVEPLPRYRYAGPRTGAVDPKFLAPAIDSTQVPLVVPAEMMLAPGESSGWIPIGKVLDSLNACLWAPYANFSDPSGNVVGLDLEIAIPDGAGGLKSVRTVRLNDDMLYFPGNFRANPVVRTRLETLTKLTDFVATLPDAGPMPKRLPIFGLMEFSGVKDNPGPLGEQAVKLALALGSNTLVASPGSWASKLGVSASRTQILGQFGTPESIKKMIDSVTRAGNDGLVRVVSLGDELSIQPLRPGRGMREVFNKKYERYLREQGVPDVRPGVEITFDPRDPLYYHSTIFSIDQQLEAIGQMTQQVADAFKGQALTGANTAPLANFMASQVQHMRPYKAGAMTLAWGEDYAWQAPEFSTQVTGYTVTAFRAGAKYRQTPIMMYVMPHSPGNHPATFRRSFYTAIAHGATMINYFCATPLSVGGTENYIDTDDLPMWRQVHQVTHEAGRFEDYVVDGKVEPAQVGLLLSAADEIITRDSNSSGGIHNLERKGIYYALRHAQAPVDMISEEDLLEGRADPLKVIYVTQQYLLARTIRALRKFVDRGGVVIGLCGGGMYDEFQRLNPEAEEFWGVSAPTIERDEKLPMILPKQDLPSCRFNYTVNFLGTLGTEPRNVPAIAWRQPLAPLPDARLGKPGSLRLLARFNDDKVAAAEHYIGRGVAVLFGFLPGTAYMKSGLPLRPMDRNPSDTSYTHFLPAGMDANLRAELVDEFLPVGFKRPAVAGRPDAETLPPLVVAGDPRNDAPINAQRSVIEITRIATRDASGKLTRLAVPLVNYASAPIDKLTVRLADLPSAPRSVRSVAHGELKPEFTGGLLTLTMPLDVADMVLIDF